MIRAALVLLMTALPAQAWQAGTEGGICTLTCAGGGAEVRLTWDPGSAVYAITLTRSDPWPEAEVFGIRFQGARPNTITTTRQRISDRGTALTVTDRGFGNVLDGLEFNDTAIAFTGPEAVAIPLDGAAEEVRAFRACVAAPAA